MIKGLEIWVRVKCSTSAWAHAPWALLTKPQLWEGLEFIKIGYFVRMDAIFIILCDIDWSGFLHMG
jgi:hypothetical protein